MDYEKFTLNICETSLKSVVCGRGKVCWILQDRNGKGDSNLQMGLTCYQKLSSILSPGLFP